DQHHAYADLMQNRNLLDQGAGGSGVGEYAAAGLDDENLALEHANVRRGTAQGANGDRRVSADHSRNTSLCGVRNRRKMEPAGRTWRDQPRNSRYSTAICTAMRLKASRITTLRGPSSTSSATATLRRTGRQFMKWQFGSAV